MVKRGHRDEMTARQWRFGRMHRLLAPLTLALLPPSTFAAERSLVTDEPVFAKGKPDGAADYVAKADPTTASIWR